MSISVHSDVGWKQISDFEWTEKAFEALESGSLKASVHFSDRVLSTRVWGPCPRCGGVLDDRQVHTAVASALGEPGRGVARPDGPALVSVDVTCGCDRVHSGAPGEAMGCGVSFRVELEHNPA